MSTERVTFAATFEAGAEADGRMPISGVAHSFRPTVDGRYIRPTALDGWLARNPSVDLPLLAQHGYVDGFASIGRVTRLALESGVGAKFGGWIGKGTPKTDEARTLVGQGILKSVSWSIRGTARSYSSGEPGLPDDVRRAFEETQRASLYVYDTIQHVEEISLVDAPADLRAGLMGAKDLEARFAPLIERLERIETLAARSGPDAGTAAAVKELFSAAWPQFQKLLLESIEPLLVDPRCTLSALLASEADDDAQAADGDECARREPARKLSAKTGAALPERARRVIENW